MAMYYTGGGFGQDGRVTAQLAKLNEAYDAARGMPGVTVGPDGTIYRGGSTTTVDQLNRERQAAQSAIEGERASLPSNISELADPFINERKQYTMQLSDLMRDPSSIAETPAYQFAFDQGAEAINRNLAAKGLRGSGQRLAELTKFGQGLASQQFFNMADLLGKQSGIYSQQPGAAGQAALQGRGQSLNFDIARRGLDLNQPTFQYGGRPDTRRNLGAPYFTGLSRY